MEEVARTSSSYSPTSERIARVRASKMASVALVIKRWLNHVDEDASGLTFEEWDPTENVDTSQMPLAMVMNCSKLRAAGFTLREVFPPEHD